MNIRCSMDLWNVCSSRTRRTLHENRMASFDDKYLRKSATTDCWSTMELILKLFLNAVGFYLKCKQLYELFTMLRYKHLKILLTAESYNFDVFRGDQEAEFALELLEMAYDNYQDAESGKTFVHFIKSRSSC